MSTNKITIVPAMDTTTLPNTPPQRIDYIFELESKFKDAVEDYAYNLNPINNLPQDIIDVYKKRTNKNATNITLKDLDEAFLHHSRKPKPESSQEQIIDLSKLKYFNNRQL